MNAETIAAAKAQLKEMGEYMLDPDNVPRHPRGFQGGVVFEEVILVVRCRDPLTNRSYICDPVELEPGQGETPESDVFLRDYATVGQRRGTPLLDVLFRLVPVMAPGMSGKGGWLDAIGGLFGWKR